MSNLSILFENDKMIAVDKPAGILVIIDQYTEAENTLKGRAARYVNGKIWVAHRINKGTTGVVLFAKDAQAHSFICRQFEKGEVHKKYLALVKGRVTPASGDISAPILIEGRKVEINPKGKESLTRYKTLESFKDFSLLEVRPETGRRHQIRIHLWSVGHPLAIDPEYTRTEVLCLSEFKRNYKSTGTEKPLMNRLSLHAASVTFIEPKSGKPMTVEAPLPRDFEVTLKQLRKHDI
jgi:23S rRNA pseudouridine955/2504/2580 synthase/23S rRNA pseudouridine1911/1915/1917 synthase